MATAIKGSTIAATYDRIVLIQDGNTMGAGTDTVNIEVQAVIADGAGALATPIYMSTNRVGIAEAAPEPTLHVVTAGWTTDVFPGIGIESTGDPALSLHDSNAGSSDTWTMYRHGATGDLKFASSPKDTADWGFDSLTNRISFQADGDLAVLAGNVGVGTDTPGVNQEEYSRLLEIAGTGGSNDAPTLLFRQTATNILAGTDCKLGAIKFAGMDLNSTESGVGAIIAAEAIAQHGGAQHDYPTELQFWTNEDGGNAIAQRMVISHSGKVGIGTTAPAYFLELSNSASSTEMAITTYSDTPAHAPYLYLRKGNAGADPVVDDDDVLGVIAFQGHDTTNFETGAKIEARVFGSASDGSDMPTELSFWTTPNGTATPTQKMTIDTNGYVGIAIVNPQNPLHVEQAVGTDNYVALFRHPTTTDGNCLGINIDFSAADPNHADQKFIKCEDSAEIRAEIRSDGGLANYSANDVNLASDIRLKKDIVPLSTEWDRLKQLEVVTFKYKDSTSDTDLYGAIAQQVQEIYPEFVVVTTEAREAKPATEATETEPATEATEAKPAYYGLREKPILWITTKVLQEAMAKIEELSAKVEALENA